MFIVCTNQFGKAIDPAAEGGEDCPVPGSDLVEALAAHFKYLYVYINLYLSKYLSV